MNTHWTHDTECYRYATRDDLPAFSAMLADPEVARWLWFAPLPEEAVAGFFGPLLDQQATHISDGKTPATAVFAVEDAEGRFLGQGAVVAVPMSPGGYEIGFQLTRAAWGRGVGTRLGKFLCAYAVSLGDAHRIEGGCLEGNAGSVALLKKLGLVLEATRPGYRLKGETRHTELSFGREVAALDRAALNEVAVNVGLA